MNKQEIASAYTDKLLAEHGSKPWIHSKKAILTGIGRQGSIASSIATALVNSGIRVRAFAGDVTDAGMNSSQFDDCDTLIMSHGLCGLDWFEDQPPQVTSEILRVNLLGSFFVSQAFVNATISSAVRKKIIMIGSMASKRILNGSAMYCASKAGLSHLARCMAWELAPKGFDVYVINPSNVEGTPMEEDTKSGLQKYRNLNAEQADVYWKTGQNREQMLRPEDIASICLDLTGNDRQYLSGSEIDMAGGLR